MSRPDLDGIDVVGMTPERAWEIATNAAALPARRDGRSTLHLGHRVAELLNQGLTRRDITELLHITGKQYDNARQAAKRAGLLQKGTPDAG